MATPAIYNFENWFRGDTFEGFTFTLTEGETEETATPIDVTGALIKMQFRLGDKDGDIGIEISTLDGTIEIVDGAGGIIYIKPFDVVLTPAEYFYDLQIVFTDDVKLTPFQGVVIVDNDTTK